MILKHLINRKANIIIYILYVVLSLTCLFFLFWNLGNMSVENWDEARHGISAYEMIKNNIFIVNTYNYAPDLWNLKPPLSFWLESLSFLIMGYNLFAFRFSSALAFFATFIVISRFLHKKYGTISALSFMLLFQSFSDMILEHCGRNGDADAIYIFCFVCSMLCLLKSHTVNHYLYFNGLFFSLAFLSKSFHAAPIFIISILYIILTKLYKKLNIKKWLIYFASNGLLVLLWGIARYFNDGWSFLGTMLGVDVIDRVSDEHATGLFYFLKYIIIYRHTQIIFAIIILCILILVLTKNCQLKLILKHESVLLLLWFIITFVIYNLSKSVNSWYFYPTFICMIIIASILLQKCVCILLTHNNVKQNRKVKIAVTTISCFILIVSILLITVGFRTNFLSVIHTEILPEQQAIIDINHNRSAFGDKHAYILKDTNSYKDKLDSWEQADILVAELYGDWHCIDGGIQSFLTDSENAVLLISKNQYLKNNCLEGYQIAANSSDYLLIEK